MSALLRPDLEVIAGHVAPGTRVLDVGCGNGDLLAELQARHNVDARGMEINAERVEKCVGRGLSVMQGDAECDLAQYNFAHWRTRAALMFGGKMPVTKVLPVSWYATPNIHHVTIADFRELIAAKGLSITQQWFFAGDKEITAAGSNWRAEMALFLLNKS